LALEIQNLILSQNGKTLLSIGELVLPEKGLVLITGPSGGGKSLLLKAILGLQSHLKTQGGIYWKNQSNNKSVGYIPQELRLSFDPNKNIKYHILEASANKINDVELFKSLEKLGLERSILNRFPHQCSGGQLQRLLLLIADINNPKIILADEAVSALDEENEKLILKYLKDKIDEDECLVLYCSHRYDPKDFDLILKIEDGRLHSYQHEEKSQQIKVKEANPSNILISLKEILLPYGQVQNPINIEVYKGMSLGFIGKSGVGKTTLIKCLAGLEKWKSGQIESYPNKLKYQIVFQHPLTSINPLMTMKEYLMEAKNLCKADYIDYSWYLEDFKLDKSLLASTPNKLSGGQLQRFTLIRALTAKPDIIIFDEAFASIDEDSSSLIRNSIRKIKSEHNLTFIFVSHDQNFLEEECEKIIQL
jgi:peptide/nickel transport system ATP-binding protein